MIDLILPLTMIYFASSADSPCDYKTRFTIANYPLPQNSYSDETILAIVFCESVNSPYAADFVNQNLLKLLFLKLHDNLDNFKLCFTDAIGELCSKMSDCFKTDQKPILQLTALSVVLIKGSEIFTARSFDSHILLANYDPTCFSSKPKEASEESAENASKNAPPTEKIDPVMTIQNSDFETVNLPFQSKMYLLFMSKKLLKVLGRRTIEQMSGADNFRTSLDPAHFVLKAAIMKLSETYHMDQDAIGKNFADMSILVVQLNDDSKLQFYNFKNRLYVLLETILHAQNTYQLRNRIKSKFTPVNNYISVKYCSRGFWLNVNIDGNSDKQVQPCEPIEKPLRRTRNEYMSTICCGSKNKSNASWKYPNVLQKLTKRKESKSLEQKRNLNLVQKPTTQDSEETQNISINIMQFRKFVKLESAIALVEPIHSSRNSAGCPFSINVDHLNPKMTYLILNDANNAAIVKTLPCKYQANCIPASVKFYPFPSQHSSQNNFMFHISENLYGKDMMNSINCADVQNAIGDLMKFVKNDNTMSSEICKSELGDMIRNYISEEIEGEFSELQPEYSSNDTVCQRSNFNTKQLLFTMDLKTNSTNVADEDNRIKVYILNENHAPSQIKGDVKPDVMNLFPAGTYGSNGGGIVDDTLVKNEVFKRPKRLIRKRCYPSSNVVQDKVTCAISNLGCGGNCVIANESEEIDITKIKKSRFSQFDEFELHLQESDEFQSGIILQDENGQEINQMVSSDFTKTMEFNDDSMQPLGSIQSSTSDNFTPGLNADCEQSSDSGYLSLCSCQSSSNLSESQSISSHTNYEFCDGFQIDNFVLISSSGVETEAVAQKQTTDQAINPTGMDRNVNKPMISEDLSTTKIYTQQIN